MRSYLMNSNNKKTRSPEDDVDGIDGGKWDSIFSFIKITIVVKVTNIQKQPSRGVLRKSCSENMQEIYRRTPMPKCDFNKVAKQLY